ncbi:hypothetical protein [Streptococcus loxodontisalivarius]|uniref:NADH:ubiquinone oxidoreductase subunit 2 (Subunit N) n=1 Tax=Streptococcus loxodontisalivarius TaxID=1349415 RepID=A0ABS2PQA7_9STRE|nr:hypothetical protein [Streptococcus loxodontisalivarius]MBM7642224.1 NADH:ubiquinone oxidoreductase subunit 2 (subunit N) [Streptococcus loxodontisalivarius]
MFFILLCFGVFKICQKANEFEELSNFEIRVLPIYAGIMFLTSMDWRLLSLVEVLGLSVISYAIARFQLTSLEVKEDSEKILIKKGNAFLIGWALSLLLGIGLEYLSLGELSLHHILENFGKDLFKELSVVGLFTAKNDWYIWLITTVMTYSYSNYLQKYYPSLTNKKSQ